MRKAWWLLLLLLATGAAGVVAWRGHYIDDMLPDRLTKWTPTETVAAPHDDGLQLSLFLLSDLHINADYSGMTQKLHTALQDVLSFDPAVDAIVFGGDLTDGGREVDYQRLQEILSDYNLPPTYGLMGNHDYYDVWYNSDNVWSRETFPNGKSDAESQDRFIEFMGYDDDKPYHDVWINGVHLIMLSQEVYQQEVSWVGEGAWYTDEQLAWFREVMKQNADGSPALVFIHQPLPPAGSDGYSHQLMRNKEFRAILAPYRNVFVFSGHNHITLETPNRYVRDTTFHWFQNGSVGKSRTDNATVENPSQGLYIQVYKDHVVVRGREFSNQTWVPGAEWTVPISR